MFRYYSSGSELYRADDLTFEERISGIVCFGTNWKKAYSLQEQKLRETLHTKSGPESNDLYEAEFEYSLRETDVGADGDDYTVIDSVNVTSLGPPYNKLTIGLIEVSPTTQYIAYSFNRKNVRIIKKNGLRHFVVPVNDLRKLIISNNETLLFIVNKRNISIRSLAHNMVPFIRNVYEVDQEVSDACLAFGNEFLCVAHNSKELRIFAVSGN